MTAPMQPQHRPAPSPTGGADGGMPSSAAADSSIGQLASQLSEQVSRLVRDELALAQAETKQRGKKIGLGVGLFGTSAALAYFALGVLLAAAVLGLATALDAWLSAVIVAAVLLVLAGGIALVGKKNVKQGSPPVPTDAISSVQADVDAVREAVKR